MKTDRRQRTGPKHVLSLILLATVSIAFGLLCFFGIQQWFEVFSRHVSDTLDWNLLGGFTSLISLAVLAGGIIFAGVEYVSKENAKTREKAKLSYEIYQAIYDKLTAPEQEAARRWILVNINLPQEGETIDDWYQKTQAKIMKGPPKKGDELPEGHAAVKLTLNCFDYIGFIAEHYWETDNDSLDWVSPPVAKVWKLLGPYVTYTRTKKNVPDYYISAEKFGNRCIQWRKDKGLPDETIIRGAPQV